MNESIVYFNTMSNHLADWCVLFNYIIGLYVVSNFITRVISLILCHERPRHRVRQIEKFVEIGQSLRKMNNYAALRAFVAGINAATNDTTTKDIFKAKSPEASKGIASWDRLFQQLRAHRAYRLALRNSKGACIPAL